MLADNAERAAAGQRLRSLVAVPSPAPRTEVQPEQAPREAVRTPSWAEQQVSEPVHEALAEEPTPRVEERIMADRATSVPHMSEEPSWESQDSSVEKLRVLEGFHRWVVSKASSIESPNDDAVALRQILVEIVGAAGFASALLSDKK